MAYRALGLVLLLAGGTAYAQDDLVESTVKEEASKVKGSVDLGYSSAAANTDTESFSFASNFTYTTLKYLNEIDLKALKASQEGVTSQERYYAAYQLNRDITERMSGFVRADYDDDRFSGFDHQYSSVAGVSASWDMPETQSLTTEVGLGYRYSEIRVAEGLEPKNDEELIYRIALDYKWLISDTATFTQNVGSDLGRDNIITRSSTELTVAIGGPLSLKLGQYYKFYSEPLPNTVSVERESTVSVSYHF